ncbi:MAG: NAD(P)H-dependent flavin oxidoreductase [Terriglobales bacterium]
MEDTMQTSQAQLCDLLGIRLPIIQAPIGSASCPELAATVSNAGGLGTLALSWRRTEEIAALLEQTRRLTPRPFAVNLVLEWPQEERLEICLAGGVRIFSFFWGDPTSLIRRVHDAGAIAVHAVGESEEAKAACAAGADGIVAQGWEAGGHVRGRMPLATLLPRVVEAVGATPVLAAGGIIDASGAAAALSQGAAGVWMGTRFLASVESAAHPVYKERILQARDTDTLYTNLFDIGWPHAYHRVLRNRTVDRWEQAGCPPSGSRPGEGEIIAFMADGRPVVRYEDVIPLPGMTGDLEDLALYAGQGAGRIRTIQPAAEIVAELEREAFQTQ